MARESRSSSAYNFIKQMPTNFDRRSGTSATSGVDMPCLLPSARVRSDGGISRQTDFALGAYLLSTSPDGCSPQHLASGEKISVRENHYTTFRCYDYSFNLLLVVASEIWQNEPKWDLLKKAGA
jgi:hypothetical protein